jgi:hypothetical protein
MVAHQTLQSGIARGVGRVWYELRVDLSLFPVSSVLP